MSAAEEIRRADARFVLPNRPASVRLCTGAEGWASGLALAGAGTSDGRPDVVVTGPETLEEALTCGAPVVAVEGRLRRPPPGWSVQEWVVVLDRQAPLALAPAGEPALLRRALQAWTPSTRAKAVVRGAASVASAVGAAPGLPRLTVLGQGAVVPEAVRLAVDLGVPDDVRAVVLTGGGSLRRRVGTLLFRPGSARPGWVVKQERTGAPSDRAEREAAVVGVARAAGVPGVNIPPVLGVRREQGASVEEAVAGLSLTGLLVTRPAVARAAATGVVDWLTRLAMATRTAGGSDTPFRDGLADAWPADAVAVALAAARAAPGVLCHSDLLDGGNVLVDGGRVSVVDWETGRTAGPPLLDLLPLLASALAVLRVGARPADVAAEVVRCAGGRSPDSAALHDAVLIHARALDVDRALIGPLALLAWLWHGAQPRQHRRLLAAHGLPHESWDSVPERVAQAWLADPRLGAEWPALSAV